MARRFQDVRILYGLDSQVALGCLVKGRSASPGLSKLLSTSVGPYICAGIVPHFMYFLTQLNPADGPTRGKPPPHPVFPLPPWWEKAAAGDFEEFDAFLLKISSKTEAPDFSHLHGVRPQAPAESLACKSGGRLKHESWVTGAPLRVESVEECVQPGSDDCTFLGFPSSQVFFQRGSSPDPSKKGCLDLFCGSGGMARALVRQGSPWVIGFDVKRSPLRDLTNPECRAAVFFFG